MVSTPTIAFPIAPKIVTMESGGQTKQVRGRPVKFNQKAITKDFRGADGEIIIPVLYESQCPFCCKKIDFAGDLKSIQCPHCLRGTSKLEHDEFVDPFCEPGDYDRLGGL